MRKKQNSRTIHTSPSEQRDVHKASANLQILEVMRAESGIFEELWSENSLYYYLLYSVATEEPDSFN